MRSWKYYLHLVSLLWMFFYVLLESFYSFPTSVSVFTMFFVIPNLLYFSPVFLTPNFSTKEELEPSEELIKHCKGLGDKVRYGSSRKENGFEEWCVIEDDGVIVKDPEVNEHLRKIDRIVNYREIEED